jgi:micrococcal nuclease
VSPNSGSSQSQAQATFEACGGTANDVHELDRDRDGIACETLP